jgi:hypothetical protein
VCSAVPRSFYHICSVKVTIRISFNSASSWFMSLHCTRCRGPFRKAEKVLKCMKCREAYHVLCALSLDDSEVDLRTSLYRSWCCSNCRVSSTALTMSGVEGDDQEVTLQMLYKLMRSNEAKLNELDTKVSRLIQLEERVLNLEESNASLHNENQLLRSRLDDLETRVSTYEKKTHNLESSSRWRNLLLTGVPQTVDENALQIARKVSTILGCAQVRIDEAHRVAHDREGSNIVVVLRTHSERNQIVMARLKRKHLYVRELIPVTSHEQSNGAAGSEIDKVPEIGVFEQLTIDARNLLFRAKANAKQLSFAQCFSYNGNVFYRKEKSAPKIMVENQRALDNMLRQNRLVDVYVPKSRRSDT